MTRRWGGSLLIVPAVLVLGCLASCQAVFTFSPLSFLQRDPSTMSEDQQLAYAAQAMHSGDKDKMLAAYEALLEAAKKDPDNPEIEYSAAELALSLSGAGTVFTDLVSQVGEDPGGGFLDIDPTIFDSLDQEKLGEAADLLKAAEGDGADLTATDCLTVTVVLLLAGAPGGDVVGTIDDNQNAEEAKGYLVQAIDKLPEGDASREMLQSLLDNLEGGSGA